MSQIGVFGLGAVSPAGWGVPALRDALARGETLPTQALARPGWDRPLRVRAVPAPPNRPAFLAHPRMRRTSSVAQFTTAAALEALGANATPGDASRLGLVLCVMSGCVTYSKRFYAETLEDPATASPLIFPETVFNAPASHLAALLATPAASYTVVGDPGAFLQGLALGATWLVEGRVDGCLVVGAEEKDWLTSEALALLNPGSVLAEGAGALYLRREVKDAAAVLERVTSSFLYVRKTTRAMAANALRAELPAGNTQELLCDSTQGVPRLDAPELQAWRDWPGRRLSPKAVLGEAFTAATAWQCVAAVAALQREAYAAATVSVLGCNQQAIGARFVQSSE